MTREPWSRWTAEEVSEIAVLRDDGWTERGIAKRYGVATERVKKLFGTLARRLEKRARVEAASATLTVRHEVGHKWKPVELARLVLAYRDGMTYGEIGKRFGVNAATVRHKVIEYRLDGPKGYVVARYMPERIAEEMRNRIAATEEELLQLHRDLYVLEASR